MFNMKLWIYFYKFKYLNNKLQVLIKETEIFRQIPSYELNHFSTWFCREDSRKTEKINLTGIF